jgi:hypothetical protein
MAALLVGIAAVIALGLGRLPGEMRDFEVYWTAAGRAMSAEPLYRASDAHFQFKYLPAFAVLAGPLALVPLPVAKALWFVISVALLAALVALSITVLPDRRRGAAFIGVAIVITMGKFYGHELVLGQVNILFAVIVLLGLLAIRKDRSAAAAVLFVAATVVKPYAVLLLPWLVLRGGVTAALAASASVGAVVILPVTLYGVTGAVDLHLAWWATVTGSTAPNLTNADNVSLAGFFAKWLGSGPAATASPALAGSGVLASVGVVMWRSERVENREMLEGALLLTAIPLLSPQGWDYVFLVATPAVAFMANYDRSLPALLRGVCWAALLTTGLSLFDIMGRDRYAAFMSWSVITVCFVIVVAGLASLRIRRVA